MRDPKPLAVVTIAAADYYGLRRHVADLEQQLRAERKRSALLEDSARRAFSVAAWGGARRRDDNAIATGTALNTSPLNVSHGRE